MDNPQRKLQRLKKYDYRLEGAYFVTLCTQNRTQYFGEINNEKMELNEAGMMVAKKFEQISYYYPNITVGLFIVMPNHLHGILILRGEGTTRGLFPTISLSECIRRFKTLTTKLYIDGVKNGKYPRFDKRLWQKSFYDRIIRNEKEYLKICEYIETNPQKWDLDEYYKC